jgi:hypothetical protein
VHWQYLIDWVRNDPSPQNFFDADQCHDHPSVLYMIIKSLYERGASAERIGEGIQGGNYEMEGKPQTKARVIQ